MSYKTAYVADSMEARGNDMKRLFAPMILLLIDSLISLITPFLALLVRFEWYMPDPYVGMLVRYAPLIVICRLTVFYAAGFYRRLWRYASIRELLVILGGVTASSVLVSALLAMVHSGLPRSISVLSWLFCLTLVGASRFAIRLYSHYYQGRVEEIESAQLPCRVMIVGAGDAGAMIARELLNRSASPYEIVGFIDDDLYKHHKMIYWVKVLGGRDQIEALVAAYKVDEIIIAMPSVEGAVVRDILQICRRTACELRTVPGLYELIDGNVSVQQLRPVQVEDLLRRDTVQLDVQEIAAYLSGKRVLVTGAGGSIGSELCRQVAKMGPDKLLLLGKGENSIYEIHQELSYLYPQKQIIPIIADVRDQERIDDIFNEWRPEVVFHAAAHKHVPLMESYPIEAVKNNIFGTKNVAEAADRYQSEVFIMISTDKAVNPTSVMGATKRVAEMLVQQMNEKSRTRFAAVRFGNVLGSRGSVIPLFKKQIAHGGPITITDPEMTRYFMTIPEASQLVLQAGALASGGEVFVLDMGKPVKILDMAEDLIRLSGLEPYKDIEIQFCGLRPGEKLYEELLTSEEGTRATKHQKIFVAGLNNIDVLKLQRTLVDLHRETSKEHIVLLLKELVPMQVGIQTSIPTPKLQLGKDVKQKLGNEHFALVHDN